MGNKSENNLRIDFILSDEGYNANTVLVKVKKMRLKEFEKNWNWIRRKFV